jgi:hypothetical protein
VLVASLLERNDVDDESDDDEGGGGSVLFANSHTERRTKKVPRFPLCLKEEEEEEEEGRSETNPTKPHEHDRLCVAALQTKKNCVSMFLWPLFCLCLCLLLMMDDG